MTDAPKSMTMDRLADTKQVIVAQATSQCCRQGICQPSINWVLREADNYQGGNPHEYDQQAWIHEESTWFMRCLSGCMPGCRETKYVQHSSTAPEAVVGSEDFRWCTTQCDELPRGLTEEERTKNVVATHSKGQSCGACCCAPAYMETKGPDGELIGKTQFVCDSCIFVPTGRSSHCFRCLQLDRSNHIVLKFAHSHSPVFIVPCFNLACISSSACKFPISPSTVG